MKRVTPAIPSMGGFFVDDSGGWGSGGIFSALKAKSKKPSRYYETAYDMKGVQYKLLQLFFLSCVHTARIETNVCFIEMMSDRKSVV